jgi:predicted MPP superfamily phosphohydrolase
MGRSSGLAFAGALALGVAAWGTLVEKNRFTLRHDVVPILNPGSQPITILHLSDIHMAPWNTAAIAWIRELVATSPDLVIGTGDFLGHPEGLSALTEALLPLAGIRGVVTHGSNDHLAPRFKNPFSYLLGPSQVGHGQGAPMDFAGLQNLYSSTLGWIDIDNGATRLQIKGQTLDFIGVGDAHYGQDALAKLPGIVDNLRESGEDDRSSAHSSVTTIGVTHAPSRRVLDALVTHGAQVVFAGHTHGGPVCLPGGRALTTNSDLPTAQARGLSQWAHAGRQSYLNVSAGLGTSMYAPVRLFCPPEAVLVTLIAGSNPVTPTLS